MREVYCVGMRAYGILSTVSQTGHADSFRRPFCKRRRSTRRPLAVLRRDRKPCRRLRMIKLGWNVRLVLHSKGASPVGGSAWRKGSEEMRSRQNGWQGTQPVGSVLGAHPVSGPAHHPPQVKQYLGAAAAAIQATPLPRVAPRRAGRASTAPAQLLPMSPPRLLPLLCSRPAAAPSGAAPAS